MKVVIIGSGNVATIFGKIIKSAGHDVLRSHAGISGACVAEPDASETGPP